jgi:hypothetical protein
MIANGHPHGLQTSIHGRQKRKKQATQQLISLFFVFSIKAFSLDFFSGGWLCKLLIAHGRVGWLTTFLLASLLTDQQAQRKTFSIFPVARTPHSSHMIRRNIKTSHIRPFNSSSFESKDRSSRMNFIQIKTFVRKMKSPKPIIEPMIDESEISHQIRSSFPTSSLFPQQFSATKEPAPFFDNR